MLPLIMRSHDNATENDRQFAGIRTLNTLTVTETLLLTLFKQFGVIESTRTET